MESILRGMINEPVSKYDTNFADTLQNHLFESRLSDGSVIAIDLAATNINRGRDHGIPPYNVARQKCGFRKAQSFQDLVDLIPADKVQVLSNIYQYFIYHLIFLFTEKI
jgi:peroxidase